MTPPFICKTHPTYQIKRPPKAACTACWLLWVVKTNADLRREIDDLKRLQNELDWL